MSQNLESGDLKQGLKKFKVSKNHNSAKLISKKSNPRILSVSGSEFLGKHFFQSPSDSLAATMY
jgi:hypothetical protein